MNSSSDFVENVGEVTEMLEQLDTESVETHRIDAKGRPPEKSEIQTRSEVDSQNNLNDQKSESANNHDDSVAPEASKKSYRPLQYIIHAETAVGPDYAIRAVEGVAYFDVLAKYSLIPDIAEFYDTEDLQTISLSDIDDDHPIFLDYPRDTLEKMEEDLGKEHINRLYTAVESLDNLDDEIKADIIYQLTEIFTTSPVKYVVNSTQEDGRGGVKGFQVFYRIFPYEDEFRLADLNDVIEKVRMASQRGKIFLKYSFQLDVDFGEETGGSSVTANPPEQYPQLSID